MVSVLLVEDDPVVRSAVTRALTGLGHAVLPVGTALEALREIAGATAFDLVVLDLGLPDMDGGDALRMMRGLCDVPVIVATARDEEAEIVRLLNAGADDYLVKPFSSEHLAARLSAVLRRARKEEAPEPLRIGQLTVYLDRREARLAGRELNLTRKEFDLLAYLAAREGKVVPRAELLANLWNLPGRHDDQTLDVHLSWLRRKLGERAAQPRYLHTVRGVGFKLTAVE